MRIIPLILLLFVSSLVTAQTADSTIIQQVDSLFRISSKLSKQREYDKALEVYSAAEQLTLEFLGKESETYGKCCYNIGRIHYFLANYAESEKWYLESKSIRAKVLGKEHSDYSWTLNNLGALYWKMGLYEKAEPFFLEVKTIRKKVLGDEHPDYAGSLSNLAVLYKNLGQYEKAEPLLIETNSIMERTQGKDHPEYTSGLNNLAILYTEMGQFKKAEALYIESKKIRERVFGLEHPKYASILNNLAGLYSDLGQYEKAEPLYLESKRVRENVLGKEDPDYAGSLNALANLYCDMGQFEKAEPLYLESKRIRENVFGNKHPVYSHSLTNLAILYRETGQFEKAEPLYLESHSIKEKTFGKEHPDYAISLNSLANLYSDMGNYEKAESFYLESKLIREKVFGKEHSSYASSLNNLAILYNVTGQYKKSELLFLEVKDILEVSLGKEHPEYAGCVNNLAVLYMDMGHSEKAEPLLLESTDIMEKVLGNEHPDYASSLNNLAKYYHSIGQYERAEPYILECKEIQEKVLGKEHPEMARSLKNLANLYARMGQYRKAESFYFELSTGNQILLAKALLHLSENELKEYLQLFSEGQDQILSFTLQSASEKTVEVCYNNCLFYKGFLLQSGKQLQRMALSHPGADELLNQLKGSQRRLTTQYTLPIAERDSMEVVQLEVNVQELEKELARTVAGYDDARRQVTWQEVQATLQPGEAAIEFVHYRYSEKETTDSIMYTALLLLPGDTPPQFVTLFEEKSLDSLLLSNGKRRADYVNNLYSLAERGMVATEQQTKSLYELIWKPLSSKMKATKKVYFSPTGLLHRINLNAIAVDEETCLADHFNLIQLNSTRQLVIPSVGSSTSSDVALFGGIQYELDSVALKAVESHLTSGDLVSRGNPANMMDTTTRGGSWTYLKWTANEVESIDEVFHSAGYFTTKRMDYTASEEAFHELGQQGNSPSVIHVATHGFFFPDPEKSNSASTGHAASESVFKKSDDPMIRSGLILAGGNQAWQNKPTLLGMEDGILTAYEISQMNLSNTELVVLSACETGLGDIQGNEGVYGLQRAFKIAGAKYLIMSLWQVPDRQTMQFMTTFYKNWLEEKMTIPQAFRKTQLEMRDRFFDAYNWAGFVLVE